MFFKSSTNQTESLVFRLNCTVTPVILCLALALVLSTQIWSDPIGCKTSNRFHVDVQLLNGHCFSRATYRSYDSSSSSDQNQNPSHEDGFTRLSQVIHYPYYQWLWVILLIQAIGFYLPNFVWKRLERNRLRNLLLKVDQKEQENIAKILNLSFGSNRGYFLGHLFCVFLILLNLVTQTLVLNRIFHSKWNTYGYDVVVQLLFSRDDDPTENDPPGIDPESYSDPMSLIFPVLTKCDYRRIGPTGSLEIYEVNCALPLNSFNQKFYLILWFWMWILVELVLVEIVILLGSYYILPLRLRRFLKGRIQLEPEEVQVELKNFISALGFADWFWLRTVERNMDSLDFYNILVNIVKLRMRTQEGKQLLNNVEDVL